MIFIGDSHHLQSCQHIPYCYLKHSRRHEADFLPYFPLQLLSCDGDTVNTQCTKGNLKARSPCAKARRHVFLLAKIAESNDLFSENIHNVFTVFINHCLDSTGEKILLDILLPNPFYLLLIKPKRKLH